MAGSDGDKEWLAERLEAVRAARKRQGHSLTGMEEAIVLAFARHDPRHDRDSATALAVIEHEIEQKGAWEEAEEWRISTWFVNRIVRDTSSGQAWFTTSVACDGQTLSCRAASLERAYSFMRLYQSVIIGGYYTVGPPWAP